MQVIGITIIRAMKVNRSLVNRSTVATYAMFFLLIQYRAGRRNPSLLLHELGTGTALKVVVFVSKSSRGKTLLLSLIL